MVEVPVVEEDEDFLRYPRKGSAWETRGSASDLSKPIETKRGMSLLGRQTVSSSPGRVRLTSLGSGHPVGCPKIHRACIHRMTGHYVCIEANLVRYFMAEQASRQQN